MNKDIAVLLLSHVSHIANGAKQLIDQVAKNVTVIAVGGTEEGGIGTSFEKIYQAIESIEEETILVFYDLGSAKMNVEMAMELTSKNITLQETAFIEGAYTAASLLEASVPLEEITTQLEPLIIKE